MLPSIEAIRENVKQNNFELSKHAVDQSIIRNIRIVEIKEAIRLTPSLRIATWKNY